jgi:NTP pyrophosphatase (non-canonical NTP hydrolase)
MNVAQRQVQDFIQAAIANGAKQVISEEPALVQTDFRLRLIVEEVDELSTAIDEDDIIGAIDALCDILYVVYGAAVSWGIDIEPFFDEVHKSNMDKFKPGFSVREDGKFIKPEDWKPPNLKLILETHPAFFKPTEEEQDILVYLSKPESAIHTDFNPRIGAYKRDNGEKVGRGALDRLVLAGYVEYNEGFSSGAWTLKVDQ